MPELENAENAFRNLRKSSEVAFSGRQGGSGPVGEVLQCVILS